MPRPRLIGRFAVGSAVVAAAMAASPVVRHPQPPAACPTGSPPSCGRDASTSKPVNSSCTSRTAARRPSTSTGSWSRHRCSRRRSSTIGSFDLSAGEGIDIRIDLPDPQCGSGEGEPLVDLRGRTADDAFTGAVAPTDPFGTLERIGATDCLTASVDAVAAITPARAPAHDRQRSAEQRAWIDVLVTPEPSGDASFVIDVVHGTTLLTAEDGPEWPLALDVATGGEPITVALAVRPARCDAHAIADDKRGTILPFEITTSDGLTGRIDRSSGDTLQAELYDYVTERCGLGTAPVG